MTESAHQKRETTKPEWTRVSRRFFADSWLRTAHFLLRRVNWIAIAVTMLITWLLLWAASSQSSNSAWAGLRQSTWAAVTGSVFAASVFLLIRALLESVEKTEVTLKSDYYNALAVTHGLMSIYPERGSSHVVQLYKSLIARADRRIWAFGMVNRNFFDQHQRALVSKLQDEAIDVIIAFWDPESRILYSRTNPELGQGDLSMIDSQLLLKKDPFPATDWARAITERETQFLKRIDELPSIAGTLSIVHLTIATNISCFIIDDDLFFFPFLAGIDNNRDPMIRCSADHGVGECLVRHFRKVLTCDFATKAVATRGPQQPNRRSEL